MLRDRLNHYQTRLTQVRARVDILNQELDSLHKRKQATEESLAILEQVNLFLASAVKDKINSTKHQLESLVNQGLQYIFNEDIRIEIASDFKNNKTIFSLKVLKGNLNSGRTEDFGGGVLAVIAFLLKVSATLITKTERLLVFDESLTFVSAEYQEALSQFIHQICQQLGFTIILIAHQPLLAKHADTIYQVQGTPQEGISFKRLESITA